MIHRMYYFKEYVHNTFTADTEKKPFEKNRKVKTVWQKMDGGFFIRKKPKLVCVEIEMWACVQKVLEFFPSL